MCQVIMYRTPHFAVRLLRRQLTCVRKSVRNASSVRPRLLLSSSSLTRSSAQSVSQCNFYSTNHHFKEDIPISQSIKQQEEEEARIHLENLSEEEKKQLEILKLEYDYFLNQGLEVPQDMTNLMWKETFISQSRTQRVKHYRFWMKREIVRNKHKEEKLARAKVAEQKPQKYNEVYGNKLLRRIKNNEYSKQNLAYSMMNGPHLVFDMGYTNMTPREERNLVDQIATCHGFNKQQLEPFHFHFCNLEMTLAKQRLFDRFCPGFDQLLYTMTDDSYLDCYPKDELLYLSPDARETLETFDHNKVYIIGGMVDKSKIEPVSWAKCRMERVRAVKLPLDKYFRWTQGSKALTIDQVVKILHTLKATNDMRTAMTHVPTRKREWREQYKYNHDDDDDN